MDSQTGEQRQDSGVWGSYDGKNLGPKAPEPGNQK